MKELDAINNRWIAYGQHANGMYWSTIRDAATNLVDSAITAPTMSEVREFWAEHNVTFADSLPTVSNR